MSMKVYFGVPGSGKSTHAAMVCMRCVRKGIPVYSNVDIIGALRIDSQDIGKVNISDGVLILDEAGIDFNNRLVMQKSSKQMSQDSIRWFKKYRHHGIGDIYIYSQSYEDFDVTLRRLADELYLIKRSLIPNCICTKRIFQKLGIDENTHQIMDMYHFRLFSSRRIYGPKYWGLFDSWEAEELPEVQFELLGTNTLYSPSEIDRSLLKFISKDMRKRSIKFRIDRLKRPFIKAYNGISKILKNLSAKRTKKNLKNP